MKLYFHPVSTTSRPILFFAADHDLALEYQVVDLFKGEHMQPAYSASTLTPRPRGKSVMNAIRGLAIRRTS